uniref:Uncharacterized protein n=1 Tax=Anguilla anguilla TaxID=7936 RepID=A0A0E9RDQ0_ANGAN
MAAIAIGTFIYPFFVL